MIASLLVALLAGGGVSSLTAEEIALAERLGADQTKPCGYLLGEDRGKWLAIATTPFGRVCSLARNAIASLRTFSFSNLSEEERAKALQPVLIVNVLIVPPRQLNDPRPEVERVVIAPTGSEDVELIQPLTEQPQVESYSNNFGVKRQTKGLAAAFPLKAFEVGNDVVLLWKGGAKRRLAITQSLLAKVPMPHSLAESATEQQKPEGS